MTPHGTTPQSSFTVLKDVLHTRVIGYFKHNSFVFGLGRTNCSKTDRKPIFLAKFTNKSFHVFLFTISTISTISFPISADLVTKCLNTRPASSKGKGKGAGFKSWSQAGSHDFTILPHWSLEMAPLLHIELYRQRILRATRVTFPLSSPLMLGRRCLMWIPISKVRHYLWKLAEHRDLNPGPIDLESPSPRAPSLPLGYGIHTWITLTKISSIDACLPKLA